jgi:hypothetical protein
MLGPKRWRAKKHASTQTRAKHAQHTKHTQTRTKHTQHTQTQTHDTNLYYWLERDEV